jgi:hypothetical protein
MEGFCEHGNEPLGSMAAQVAASQEGLSCISK